MARMKQEDKLNQSIGTRIRKIEFELIKMIVSKDYRFSSVSSFVTIAIMRLLNDYRSGKYDRDVGEDVQIE